MIYHLCSIPSHDHRGGVQRLQLMAAVSVCNPSLGMQRNNTMMDKGNSGLESMLGGSAENRKDS